MDNLERHPELSEDERIVADAASVEEAVLTRGWRLILARLDQMRQEALVMVLSVGNSHEVGIRWRERLATLDEVIGLPRDFQDERGKAQEALTQEQAYAGILHAA